MECIGRELAPAFIAYYEREVLDMERIEAGAYSKSDFPQIDDKLYALSSLLTDESKSEEVKIDFIETCLGEEYVAIYEAMKAQREETLETRQNKTSGIKR